VRRGSLIGTTQSRLGYLRAGEAIEELRRCGQLPRDLRLDSECDQRVERVVRELMQSGTEELAALRRDGGAELPLLLEWADRASSLAVRRRDADLLVGAVFAFGFADSAGADEWSYLQSQLRQATRIIGRDADDTWSAAIARSDDQGAAWLDANRGRRRFFRGGRPPGQFSDPYDGGRFRFGRPRSASDRVPLVSKPPERPDLSSAAALGPTPIVRDALEDLIADLWRTGRRDDADALLHAVLSHDDPDAALNELYAALADMPAAADSLLAAVLARG
jgi:hypothetical protein